MKTLKFISLILIALLVTSSTIYGKRKIKGSGVVAKEERSVSSFNKLETSTAINVTLTKGNNIEVIVEADDNIVPYISTKVKREKLIIEIDGPNNGIDVKSPMKVYVTVPEITEVSAGSASSVKSDDLWVTSRLKLDVSSAAKVELEVSVKELEVEVSSAAHLDLSGKAGNMDCEVSSTGKLNAETLEVNSAKVEASSMGSAKIWVTDNISYEVSSMGSLQVKGSPQVKKSDVSSMGKIKFSN
ncbi:MAG: DUF2807 domain-containing protein [Odoribacter sp.]|nr:DUF2807 domain-containing protein [Odoribacter sp.]